jgi:hypothetical protein
MKAVAHLGLSVSDIIPNTQRSSLPNLVHQSTEHRLAHLDLLLKPRMPSKLESLATEIITHIAQIAQDQHVKAETPIHENGGKCLCHGGLAMSRGYIGISKELIALGGTSRRIRAVLVNAGFFGTISLKVDEDRLFATSVVTTPGLLEKAQ